MSHSIFVGGDKLWEAYQRVGAIINSCAELEEAVSYLEWQLTAFSWDRANTSTSRAGRQVALHGTRKGWNRFANLNTRLERVNDAFAAAPVAKRVQQDVRIGQMHVQWDTMRQRAYNLGDRRNAVAHSTIWFSDGKVLRGPGRIWQEKKPVNPASDTKLSRDLHSLAHEIGTFTTELGYLLPFADDDKVITLG